MAKTSDGALSRPSTEYFVHTSYIAPRPVDRAPRTQGIFPPKRAPPGSPTFCVELRSRGLYESARPLPKDPVIVLAQELAKSAADPRPDKSLARPRMCQRGREAARDPAQRAEPRGPRGCPS